MRYKLWLVTHPVTNLIASIFDRHCRQCHNADYEVCKDLQCRIAYRVERIFRRNWWK